jgi:hypothetical protein
VTAGQRQLSAGIPMKFWLQEIFSCEFPKTTDREVLDRVVLFNIIVLVYLLTAVPFSIMHAARGTYLLAFFLLAGSALLIGIREYLRITRRHRASFVAATFLILPIFLINYITGGVNNNGPLWYYTYPMVALILVGPLLGSVAAVLLLLISILLLVEPFDALMMTTYSSEFLLRFFMSYSIVLFLAFSYEFQKYRTRKQIKRLSSLLPICSNCKNVRDDRGYWNEIEAYFAEHSKAEFSHSICPECAKKLYPDLEIYD